MLPQGAGQCVSLSENWIVIDLSCALWALVAGASPPPSIPLRFSGIWHFFQIYNISLLSAPNWHAKWIYMLHTGTCTQILTATGWKTLRQFACHFEALKSGILQKRCQNNEILRNLALFSDLQYSTSDCFELVCKLTRPDSSRHSRTDSHGARPENVETICAPIRST
jgi:hypothetical protein